MTIADLRTADFSDDGRYRYSLTRTWDTRLERCGFVMLNPSIADGTNDDATIRRCKGFAREWGYGGIIVRNLYGLVSTDPDGLWVHPDPVGPDNDEGLHVMLHYLPRVIAAWGVNARPDRVAAFWRLAAPRLDERYGWGPVECLGTTKGGQPRHPLRLRADTQPVVLESPT